jgi:hypothetical protein
MKKLYRKKDRVVDVKVSLTIDQVAVLMNHCLYRSMFSDGPSDLSLREQVQFSIDYLCSVDGGLQGYAQEITNFGDRHLPFDPGRLPGVQ